MDTSEKYILMCDKAKEIQEQRDPNEGDYFVFNVAPENIHVHCFGHDINQAEMENKKLTTWLPKQDQLQAMIKEKKYVQFPFLTLREFLIESESKDIMFESWEQLWLAFVMKEKHNKFWIEDATGHGFWISQESLDTLEKAGLKGAAAGKKLRKMILAGKTWDEKKGAWV